MDQIAEKLCEIGNEANKLFASGFYKEAEKKYLEIITKLEKSKQMDSYIVSKSVLGLLITAVKSQNFERAAHIWVNHSADSVFSIGIAGLENAQTSVHDMLVYDFVCAYLHTVTDSKPQHAAKAVNLYLSRVCEHALELKDEKLMKLALSNWKQHLREIYSSSLPHGVATELIRFEKKFGKVVSLSTIDFPKLSNWKKPDDFREMSRLLNVNEGDLTASNLGGINRKLKV